MALVQAEKLKRSHKRTKTFTWEGRRYDLAEYAQAQAGGGAGAVGRCALDAEVERPLPQAEIVRASDRASPLLCLLACLVVLSC